MLSHKYKRWKLENKNSLNLKNKMEVKNPAAEPRGVEDSSLRSSHMRGNKSPAPPVLRLRGRGIEPLAIK
jgi:hypothetical protein